jgi:MYXO-CTERM domain-containing protein
MRQAIAILAVAGLAGAASANDFTGAYDPANWTIADVAGGSVVFNGNTGVTLTSGDIGLAGDTTVTIAAAATGTFSFDWSYSSGDSGDFDSGGYIHNGQFFLGQNDTPGSGSVAIAVNAGDTIGWYVNTLDGAFGPGTLAVTNFRGPIPAPGAAALLGLGGLALVRRRR